MHSGEIRIGIIGAGQIVRTRHLPGLMNLRGVRVVGVCNQRRESAARVAREFGIPKVFGAWENLIDDDQVNAVLIGAWPSMHCPVTLAAFDADKHVLTQARMAMNAREASRMYDRSRESSHLTSMIVPSPYGLTGDATMRSLIAGGFLGALREIHVHGMTSDLADPDTPIGWRQMTKYSGFNMLTLGILYETVLRWAPPANRVFAYASKVIPIRPDPEPGKPAVRVGTPDCLQVLTTQEDGSCGSYRLSGVVCHNAGMGVELYGSEGTLIYDLGRDEIHGGRRGEPLAPIVVPENQRGGWQVESDFIAAIRGERPVTHTTFAAGVQYMQFTEAVARSSRHQQPIALPLKEFSNPSL